MTFTPGDSSERALSDSILLGWKAPKPHSIGFTVSKAAIEHGLAEPIYYDGPHLATIAPSGTGKCVSCAVPTLLTYPGQAIVLDVKGELYQTTHRRRREMGQLIIKIDPFRYIEEETDAINSLDINDLPNADLETDCQTLAKLLSSGKGFSKDPFWELSANGLISGILAYIASCEPSEKRHLGRLMQLLYSDDVVYNLAVLLDTQGKKMAPMAYQEIAAFLQQPERETRPSVLATAQSFLKGMNSRRVIDSLLKSSFSLNAFRQGEPMTIYMVIPPDRLQSHAALLSLWVGTMLKTIFSRTTMPRNRTLLLLDEAASLGNFPMLETAVTLCRSYGVRVWSFWQDLQQLQSCFPVGWRTIINNSGIQTFGINSMLLAQELAPLLGVKAGELMSIQPDEQFLQLGQINPVRCTKLNYLKDAMFQRQYDNNRFYDSESNGKGGFSKQ